MKEDKALFIMNAILVLGLIGFAWVLEQHGSTIIAPSDQTSTSTVATTDSTTQPYTPVTQPSPTSSNAATTTVSSSATTPAQSTSTLLPPPIIHAGDGGEQYDD